MSRTPILDKKLGLHQEISIIYMAGAYQAKLVCKSEKSVLEGDPGDSVAQALANLEWEAFKQFT